MSAGNLSARVFVLDAFAWGEGRTGLGIWKRRDLVDAIAWRAFVANGGYLIEYIKFSRLAVSQVLTYTCPC